MPRKKQFETQDIIEKAMKLFWLQGYHATSMQNLVGHLGINRASIYDTFGSKRALYELAVNRYHTDRIQEVKDFLYQHVNIREGLHALMQWLAANDNPPGCFIANAMGEIDMEDTLLRIQLNDYRKAFEGALLDYLAYGVQTSQLSPYKNLQEIASYLYVFQSGLRTTSRVASHKDTINNSINLAVKVLN